MNVFFQFDKEGRITTFILIKIPTLSTIKLNKVVMKTKKIRLQSVQLNQPVKDIQSKVTSNL